MTTASFGILALVFLGIGQPLEFVGEEGVVNAAGGVDDVRLKVVARGHLPDAVGSAGELAPFDEQRPATVDLSDDARDIAD
jgi:hypothetical protein